MPLTGSYTASTGVLSTPSLITTAVKLSAATGKYEAELKATVAVI